MTTGMSDLHTVDGFWCRVGTADRIAVQDTARLARKPGFPGDGDVVLDLGAHIGSFTKRALTAGATYVLAVEPDPANIEMFKINIAFEPRVGLMHAAVGSHSGSTALYLGKTHGHTTTPRPGRPKIAVPSVTLANLFLLEPFTYVKIDVEGAEYDLDLPHSLPSSVDRVFMEFHLTFGNRPKGEALRAEFARAGWAPVWETNWRSAYVEGVFSRTTATS